MAPIAYAWRCHAPRLWSAPGATQGFCESRPKPARESPTAKETWPRSFRASADQGRRTGGMRRTGDVAPGVGEDMRIGVRQVTGRLIPGNISSLRSRHAVPQSHCRRTLTHGALGCGMEPQLRARRRRQPASRGIPSPLIVRSTTIGVAPAWHSPRWGPDGARRLPTLSCTPALCPDEVTRAPDSSRHPARGVL